MYFESIYVSKNDGIFCFQLKRKKAALFATENHFGITFRKVRTILV